jgi:Tat protein secretion system quality control protein TatD with DNase activity
VKAFLAAAVAAAALTGCTTTPPALVDSHVHLNNTAMQLALMDEYGVERAVVFWGRLSDNESVLDAEKKHTGRFIPFASISPERRAYRPQWQRDDPALLEELKALLASGRYKGIGEISVVHAESAGFVATDFDLNGPTMRGIMMLAREYRVPVMVHCEITRETAFSLLLEAFPGVAVIWAHGGYSNAADARRLLARHPNLHYELSARTWPRHPRSADYTIMPDGVLKPEWRELIEAMPHRFLVGTDASHHVETNERMKIESVRAFLAQVSPQAQWEIARNVLLRLIGERS